MTTERERTYTMIHTAIRRLAALGFLLAAGYACSVESAGPELSAQEANRRVQAGEMILVDIRRPEEWRQTGVAKGAARLDMRDPAFADKLLQLAGGDPNAPVGIICRTGNRTTQMQRALAGIGFTQVYNVREGMAGSQAGSGWIRQGLPVEPCERC
jgi:rhodanese-related sulfurtransferase